MKKLLTLFFLLAAFVANADALTLREAYDEMSKLPAIITGVQAGWNAFL